METIREAFADFLKAVYPDGAPEGEQLKEVRRVFFAGTWAVLSNISPNNALKLGLKDMVREALQFNEDMRAGIA